MSARNRVSVVTSAYYWQITVTPATGRPVVGYFPNGRGVRGAGATPRWFIRGIRDMGNAREFPCLHVALDSLARLVDTAGVRVASGLRVNWAELEEWLADTRSVARGDWSRN